MDDVRQNQNAQAAKEYAAAWFQKMVEIWGDKMRLLDIHDTGALQQSIANRDFALSDANMKMSFEFMAYGIYVDAGVQRSKGALCYYKYGSSAWMRCFAFAFNSARRRLCHFFPMLRHLYQGIRYVKRH